MSEIKPDVGGQEFSAVPEQEKVRFSVNPSEYVDPETGKPMDLWMHASAVGKKIPIASTAHKGEFLDLGRMDEEGYNMAILQALVDGIIDNFGRRTNKPLPDNPKFANLIQKKIGEMKTQKGDEEEKPVQINLAKVFGKLKDSIAKYGLKEAKLENQDDGKLKLSWFELHKGSASGEHGFVTGSSVAELRDALDMYHSSGKQQGGLRN